MEEYLAEARKNIKEPDATILRLALADGFPVLIERFKPKDKKAKKDESEKPASDAS